MHQPGYNPFADIFFYYWYKLVGLFNCGPFAKKNREKTFARPLEIVEKAAKEKRI